MALLVIGPKQLPEAVRACALTIGRIKRSINAVRHEVEKQVGMDDIKNQLYNEEVLANLEEQEQLDKQTHSHTKDTDHSGNINKPSPQE